MRKITPTKADQPKVDPDKWTRILNKWKREAASPEYRAEATKVFRALGIVTRGRYLEMMIEMEEKYPGRGWKQEAWELEEHFRNLGKPLNEIPNGIVAVPAELR